MNPVVLLVLLAVSLTACKRHETAAGSPPPPVDQSAVASSESPGPTKEIPTETVIVPDNADMSATLGELSQQLRVYVSRTRTRPKDFQDFVTHAHVQAPPPPAGKAYAISAGKIILVKQ